MTFLFTYHSCPYRFPYINITSIDTSIAARSNAPDSSKLKWRLINCDTNFLRCPFQWLRSAERLFCNCWKFSSRWLGYAFKLRGNAISAENHKTVAKLLYSAERNHWICSSVGTRVKRRTSAQIILRKSLNLQTPAQ